MSINNFNEVVQNLNVYFIIIFSILSTLAVQKIIRGDLK